MSQSNKLLKRWKQVQRRTLEDIEDAKQELMAVALAQGQRMLTHHDTKAMVCVRSVTWRTPTPDGYHSWPVQARAAWHLEELAKYEHRRDQGDLTEDNT